MGVLRRRWRRGRRWLTDHLEAWQDARFEAKEWQRIHQAEERERMLELDTLQKAQAKALLAQLDPQTTAALQAVIREEVLPELHEEALTRARTELTEELTKGKERLEDRYAALVSSFADEIERRIEDGIARGTRDLKDELEDTITELKGARQEARQHRDQAQASLVALVQQLLPPDKKVYLYSAGLRELSLVDLNTVLGRSGVVIKARETFSERQVKCQLGPSRWAQRSLFWLDRVTPDGVKAELDEPEPARAEAEASAETPVT